MFVHHVKSGHIAVCIECECGWHLHLDGPLADRDYVNRIVTRHRAAPTN